MKRDEKLDKEVKRWRNEEVGEKIDEGMESKKKRLKVRWRNEEVDEKIDEER